MQYIVIAHDYTDSEALNRRLEARPAHLALCDKYTASGALIYAVALLNDAGTMCGSVMVWNVADKNALNPWLAQEPYMLGRVWENIEVRECKVGAAFAPPQTS